MPGRIILSEYVYVRAASGRAGTSRATPRIGRIRGVGGGLNLSHFILLDYARVKLPGDLNDPGVGSFYEE